MVKFIPNSINGFDGIYRSVFPEVTDSNGLFSENAIWHGLFERDQLIAFATIGVIDAKRAFVYNIGVVPLKRQKGYGKQIMDELLTDYGHLHLYLFVSKQNRAAINLYRKYGFIVAERAFVPPKGEICMHKVG